MLERAATSVLQRLLTWRCPRTRGTVRGLRPLCHVTRTGWEPQLREARAFLRPGEFLAQHRHLYTIKKREHFPHAPAPSTVSQAEDRGQPRLKGLSSQAGCFPVGQQKTAVGQRRDP